MTSADATLAVGQQQAQSGNYQAAAETFKCVLAEEPKNLSARVSLAHVYSYLGRYEEAEKIFIEVIESEPDRLDLRITLAQLYAHIDRRAEAIARFREVIEIDPVDSDAWAGIVNLALSGAAPAKHDLGEVAGQSGGAAVSDERRQTYRERRRLILADRLHALLDDTDKFVLLDAGARDVQDDPRWRGLPDNKMKTYTFEPDKA